MRSRISGSSSTASTWGSAACSGDWGARVMNVWSLITGGRLASGFFPDYKCNSPRGRFHDGAGQARKLLAVIGIPVALRQLGAGRSPEHRRHTLRDHRGEVVPVAMAIELAHRSYRFDLRQAHQPLAAARAEALQRPHKRDILGELALLVVAAEHLEVRAPA